MWRWDESVRFYKAVLLSYVDKCGRLAVTGRWNYLESFQIDVGKTVEVHTGYKSSTSITDESHWQRELSTSVSAGFSAFGASVEISVAASFATGASQSIARASEHSVDVTETISPTRSGVLWQWTFSATDECNDAELLTSSNALTSFRDELPCCPPGLFADSDQAHGGCRHRSLCMCGEETCNSFQHGLS